MKLFKRLDGSILADRDFFTCNGIITMCQIGCEAPAGAKIHSGRVAGYGGTERLIDDGTLVPPRHKAVLVAHGSPSEAAVWRLYERLA